MAKDFTELQRDSLLILKRMAGKSPDGYIKSLKSLEEAGDETRLSVQGFVCDCTENAVMGGYSSNENASVTKQITESNKLAGNNTERLSDVEQYSVYYNRNLPEIMDTLKRMKYECMIDYKPAGIESSAKDLYPLTADHFNQDWNRKGERLAMGIILEVMNYTASKCLEKELPLNIVDRGLQTAEDYNRLYATIDSLTSSMERPVAGKGTVDMKKESTRRFVEMGKTGQTRQTGRGKSDDTGRKYKPDGEE